MKAQPDLGAMRSQAGYTLVELSISVAIIAVLIVTGLVGVPRILDTNKTSLLTQQVSIAQANYSKMATLNTQGATNSFADVGTAYASGTASPLASMGIWPEESVSKSSGGTRFAVTHPWGGYIYSRNITAGLTGSLNANEGYILKLGNIPSKQCVAVTTALGSTAVQIGVDGSASPASGVMTADPVLGNANLTSVKVADSSINYTSLATECGKNTTVGKTIVAWLAY